MLISILIPAYDEEKTIELVVKLILKFLQKYDFEIIIVDDGSKDKTESVCKNLMKKSNKVKYFRHKKNEGKTQAIKTALSISEGDIIIIQDADMEYHPKFLEKVINPILINQADVCYGSRFKGKIYGMKPSHVFGNLMLSLITFILFGIKTSDMETGYKAFKRNVITNIEIKGKGFELEPLITAQIAKKGIRFKEVAIDYNTRQFGDKHISWNDGLRAIYLLLKLKLTKI